MSRKIDFLIIGQGLAGTMMAWHLGQRGKSVLVVDNGEKSSSAVAAGLFNPVTGRRFVKSWMVDDLLPYASLVYQKLAGMLGREFYFQVPIIHYISGKEEKTVYDRAITEENKNYISAFYTAGSGDQYASCEIKGSGFVDTSLLINSFRNYLKENNAFKEADFQYQDLIISQEHIRWQEFETGAVIFCEGYRATQNPFFKNLPFNLARGEILTVKIEGFETEKILISGIFLAPIGNGIYKLGATYGWDNLEAGPTEAGKEELLLKLKNITDMPVEILNHEAGVRPTVKHRRPFLGNHPQYKNLYILNGLGTKGVLLAPYFANELCDYILDDKELSKEVNVKEYQGK